MDLRRERLEGDDDQQVGAGTIKLWLERLLPRRGLQTQMLFYVAFLATVFLTMAVEITLFLRGPRVLGAIEAGAEDGSIPVAEVVDVLDLVLIKIALMLAILLLSIALVMTLFIKRITIPLARIISGAARIGEGNLGETIVIETQDELGRLASSVNDLAANYQEILLLSGDMTARARTALAKTREGPADTRATAAQELAEILAELESVVAEFGQSYFERAAH